MKLNLIFYLKNKKYITQNDLDGDYNQIITNIVFKYYNIDLKFLHSKSRKRELVQSRHMVCYLAYLFNNKDMRIVHSLKNFLIKDRTTILHSIKTMDNLINTNKEIKNDFFIILSELKSDELLI